MGIRNAQKSSLLSELPSSEREDLTLFPGDQNEMWDEYINVRLQFDGNYQRIRPRGGLTSIESFFGQVRTINGFSAYAKGSTKDYVVIHTAVGAAYLINKTDHIEGPDTPDKIFPDGTFNTTGQVSIFHFGTVIYIFDFIDEVYKVYDIETEVSYNWLSNQSTSIQSWTWMEQGDWTEPNLWGFEEGSEILVLQNFVGGSHIDPETNLLSYRSFRATIDTLTDAEIYYISPSGVVRSTTESEFIGIIHAAPDTEDYVDYSAGYLANGPTVQGSFQVLSAPSGADSFFMNVGGVRVPDSGLIQVASSDTAIQVAQAIESELNDSLSIRALWNVTRDGASVFLDRMESGDRNNGLSFSTENLAGNININANDPIPDQIPRPNPNYTAPAIYRGYLVVDLLVDGSYAISGRPDTVVTSLIDLVRLRRTGIEFTLPAPQSNVERRYLFATRWQTSDRDAFTPSRPEYPNSGFFLVKEVSVNQVTVQDTTDDSQLITPIEGFIRMSAGIPLIFGPNQLTPNSGATHEGALFLGGYKINRPTPMVYAGPANNTNGNVYRNFSAGTALTGDPEVYVQFEYTDGKSSSLVSTGEILTDATKEITSGLAAANAQVTFEFTLAPASGESVTIDFEVQGVGSTSFSGTLSGGSSTARLSEMVNGIRDAINSNISGVTADATGSTGQILRVTWDTAGFEANQELAIITYTSPIEVENNVSGQLSKSFDGGNEEIPALIKSGNEIQVHSLNALVSKVYIVAEMADGSFVVLREIESSDPEFHGKRVYLPNTDNGVSAGSDYTPAVTPLPVVELSDSIVMATPFNQPLISEQFRVENSERIRTVIPTEFDIDKTQMRFRMTVFTDQSVQIGYVILDGENATFDFEIIGAGVAVTNRYGAWRVEGSVFYQSEDGIYVYSQKGASKIIDRYQYDILGTNLQTVMYNRQFGEYWLMFSDSRVLITSIDGSVRKIFDYSSELGPVRSGTYSGDTMLLAVGSGLYLGEVDGAADDDVPIIGELISAPIGDYTTQDKILEVTVGGQGLDAEVGVDLSEERLERTQLAWNKGFEITEQSLPKTLYIHGTPFQFHRRGVMPRVRIKTTGDSDGFISHISLTHILTENKGKAR